MLVSNNTEVTGLVSSKATFYDMRRAVLFSSICILMYFIYCYWNRIINQRREEKYGIFQVITQKKSDCICSGQKSSECQVPHTDKYSAPSV